MFLSDFVCLSVCEQDNSKSYGWIFLKFWGYVKHGINYQWFNFGRDPAEILDSGTHWNFRYHCIKGDIREQLAKRRWWRHLANSFALAEVHAGYDCFLVHHLYLFMHLFIHSLTHMKLCNTRITPAHLQTVYKPAWYRRAKQQAVHKVWALHNAAGDAVRTVVADWSERLHPTLCQLRCTPCPYERMF